MPPAAASADVRPLLDANAAACAAQQLYALTYAVSDRGLSVVLSCTPDERTGGARLAVRGPSGDGDIFIASPDTVLPDLALPYIGQADAREAAVDVDPLLDYLDEWHAAAYGQPLRKYVKNRPLPPYNPHARERSPVEYLRRRSTPVAISAAVRFPVFG